MKISKVDRARMAVGRPKDLMRGRLYYDPQKQDKKLPAHINKRIEAARRLYNALDERKITSQFVKAVKSDELKRQVRKFNNWIKQSAKQADIAAYLKKAPEMTKKFPAEQAEACAKRLVAITLRKGLSKQGDFLTDCLYWFLLGDPRRFAKEMGEAEAEGRLAKFVALLTEDYGKEKQGKAIQKSIEHQDVKVQVALRDGEAVLALANYDHPKKKALFAWMIRYGQDTAEIETVLYTYVDRFFGIAPQELATVKHKMVVSNLPVKNAWGKFDHKQTRVKLDHWLRDQYRAAKDCTPLDTEALYWYEVIQGFLQKYFSRNDHLETEEKLTYGNLIAVTQSQLRGFLTAKLIDLGKAVYHFCDMLTDSGDKFGQVLEPYKQASGITSFDYEWIKAQEKWEQELAVSVVYAANIFSQAISPNHEGWKDILSMDSNEFELYCKQNATLNKSLLRFWGGASQCRVAIDAVALAQELQQGLYALRNTSFHYGTQKKSDLGEYAILSEMARQDKQQYGQGLWKKYLTNNVFAFYPQEQICKLVEALHKQPKYTPSFTPAFASVFKPQQVVEFINCNNISLKYEDGKGQAVQFRGALYFVLKEIYYYDFLRDDGRVLKYFKDAFREEKTRRTPEKQLKNKDTAGEALENFAMVTDLYAGSTTFAAVCQRALMTYALHNNDHGRNKQNEKNKQDKQDKQDKQGYAHCKLILNHLMHRAFERFIKVEYSFLLQPSYRSQEADAIDDMLQYIAAEKYDIMAYDTLFSEGMDEKMWAYYALGKLLPPQQLNLLVGSLKSYQQYANDIKKRSGYAGAAIQQAFTEEPFYHRVTEILQFCLLTGGQISPEFADYYESKADYAVYLRNYVDFEDSGVGHPYADLENFCKDALDKGNGQYLYLNEKEPILYRGIELARLYGLDRPVYSALEQRAHRDKAFKYKVTIGDIAELSQATEELAEVLKRGNCQDETEQQSLRKYQNLKQKVELHDVQTYSELLFDLYSPLIAGCYKRERDNMYLLLGYHYIKKFWTANASEFPWQKDMLRYMYQVFHHGEGLTVKRHEWEKHFKIKEGETRQPKKVPIFAGNAGINTKKRALQLFSCEPLEDCAFAVEALMNKGGEEQLASLQRRDKKQNEGSQQSDEKKNKCLKEDQSEVFVQYRNYIDHFEYFRKGADSMRTLYQNAYYYMSYDRKLQNAVLLQMKNILERYFLEADLSFDQSGKNVILQRLQSKKLTYKLPREKTVDVDARSAGFCKNVEAILVYPEKREK